MNSNVLIKSGAGAGELLTIDTSNAARATEYATNGSAEKILPSYMGICSTYRIIGNTGTTQNVLTIENRT